MRRLVALLALLFAPVGAWAASTVFVYYVLTVSELPGTGSANVIYVVTDGDAADDCSTGGGSTRVICTWNGSAYAATGDGGGVGVGDITDVFSCASGDCSSITIAATDLLDLSGADASTTTEGLILPQHATACSGGTAEGQVCWEADANILHIGDGASLKDFPSASAFSGDATVTGTGVVAVADNSHNHTESNISDLSHTTDTTLSQEQVEDFAGAMVAGNTETGIAVTYQDTDGTLDFVAEVPQSEFDTHEGNASIHHTATVDTDTDCGSDIACTFTDDTWNANVIGIAYGGTNKDNSAVVADGEILVYDGITDNAFESVPMSGDATISAAGAVTVADNSHSHTEANISDLSHTTDTTLSQEQVEDFAGALIGDGTGTHTGIAVTYQDATGDVDMVIDHDAATNFSAAEHVDWAGASAGTIHATNYVDDDAPDDDSEVPDALTIAGGTIGTSTITLVQGAAPTPTAEGVIEWETDQDHIVVGDAVDQVHFVPTEDFSGDATVTTAGVVTVADDSHAHGTTTISGILAADMGDADHGAVSWSSGVATVEDLACTDCVDATDLKDTDTPGDEECLTYEATGTTMEWQACGGAEINDLEATDPPTIADTEIYVGNGAGSGTFVVVSGDATLANTGALTVSDDSHNHGTTTISGVVAADMGDADHGDVSWTSSVATVENVQCTTCIDMTSEVTGTLPVANGGTGATTLTDGGILLGSGSGAITALGAASNGQIPIGDGTTDPVLGTITAVANETDVTNGAGSITIGIVTSPTLDGTNFTGIPSSAITTEVRSMYWPAAAMSADATQCADPSEVTINSGPKTFTVICTDNDASTLYGHVVMPDGWDAGTVTFELEYLQTAADTSALNSDVAAMCRGATETVNNTWGTEIAIDDAAVTGSNAVDHTTSSAVTANGTCVAGDTLFWRWQLDATGTTTAVATLHILGMKMEYTSNVGD